MTTIAELIINNNRIGMKVNDLQSKLKLDSDTFKAQIALGIESVDIYVSDDTVYLTRPALMRSYSRN